MELLPRVEPPRSKWPMTPMEATQRVVNSLEIQRMDFRGLGRRPAPTPTPAPLPLVEDLVITAASHELPPITLDDAFDMYDDYRSASKFGHKGTGKPQDAPKPAPPPPQAPKPKPAPEPPKPPTPKPGRGFGR